MTTTSTVDLTNSEQSVLRACPWKHRLRYELELEPAGGEARSSALHIGSLTHYGIAEVYRSIQRMQLVGVKPSLDQLHAVVEAELKKRAQAQLDELSMFAGGSAEEEREAILSDVMVATTCLDLFVENIALPNFERYSIIGVEVPFRVPILTEKGRRSGDHLEGVIDLLAVDNQLRTIVQGENKTTVEDAHAYEVKLTTHPQPALYTYAMRHMFGPERVQGQILLNVIRKKRPSEPSVNQDGSVSVAACDTTREIYRRALDAQGDPDWFVKARDELTEAEAEGDEKRLAKAKESWTKVCDRKTKLEDKQRGRLEQLPGIERFVYQHEDRIDPDLVERVARDAWTSARLIRLFRRGVLTPWRNGNACEVFGRLCAYHEACVDDVIEPGDLLQKRPSRHPEVIEARAEGVPDLASVLAVVDQHLASS